MCMPSSDSPIRSKSGVSWAPLIRHRPRGNQDLLRIIELYEDDEVCDSPILVIESGFNRTEVDDVLKYLWLVDRIRVGP